MSLRDARVADIASCWQQVYTMKLHVWIALVQQCCLPQALYGGSGGRHYHSARPPEILSCAAAAAAAASISVMLLELAHNS